MPEAEVASLNRLGYRTPPMGLDSGAVHGSSSVATDSFAPHTFDLAGAILAPLAVVLVTLLAYSNAPGNVIIHDDNYFYPSRAGLDLKSITGVFQQDVWEAATGTSFGLYRPFLLISLAIDTALFQGSARGAHWVNVALHVAATLMVYGFSLALLRAYLARSSARPDHPLIAPVAAASAAAVFGTHPIHTEVVDLIFNRSEMLTTLFVVAALAAIWRWDDRHRVLAWSVGAIFYLAALLSRESAVALPAIAILLLWLKRPEAGLASRRFWPVTLLLVPLAIYLTLRNAALATTPVSTQPSLAEHPMPTDAMSRVAFSLATLVQYVRMIVWPHPLRISYEDFVGAGLPLALFVNGAILALAAFLSRSAPGVTFGIGFFYLVLLPSTRVLTDPSLRLSLGNYVLFRPVSNVSALAERMVYLPSAGIAVAFAFGVVVLARRVGPRVVIVLGLILATVLALPTRRRNLDWSSALALAEADVHAAPENGDAWRNYAGALFYQHRYDAVVDICDTHGAEHPRSVQLQNTCGIVYERGGRLDDAVIAYRRTVDAGLASGHTSLGRLFLRMGRLEESEQEFRLAAEAETDQALRHYAIGRVIEQFHPERLDEARAEYRRALELRPGLAVAQAALQRIDRQKGPP